MQSYRHTLATEGAQYSYHVYDVKQKTQKNENSTRNGDQSNFSPYLSLVIPVRNKQEIMPKFLPRIKATIDNLAGKKEILFVNDGSTDGTLGVLKETVGIYQDNNTRFRVISYDQSKGSGAALTLGILNASGEMVCFSGGEFGFDQNDMQRCLEELPCHDLVLSSTESKYGDVDVSLFRKFLYYTFGTFATRLLGKGFDYPESGIRIGNTQKLKKVCNFMLAKGHAFDVELLTVASSMNLPIKQILTNRRDEKPLKLANTLQTGKDLLAIWFRHRIKNWYDVQLRSQKYLDNIEKIRNGRNEIEQHFSSFNKNGKTDSHRIEKST